jgi:phage repressor protein C with HTH and peptisase S24 domain
MGTVRERLQERLNELKAQGREVTVKQIADECGIEVQAVYQWLSGETKNPKAMYLIPAAKLIGVHFDWLARGRGPKILEPVNNVEPDEIGLTESQIPVVGTAQLGDEGYWTELQYPTGHGEGFVRYPTRDKNAYALRVKGDSMRPRIKPGEFVVVEPNHPVAPGDEVLVTTTDGRSMVKVLGSNRAGMVELLSINDDHRPITLEQRQVEKMHYVGGIIKAGLYHDKM